MRMWLSGRASPCQGEGREFESRHPLHFFVSLAQLDRASGYGPEGRGFESSIVRQDYRFNHESVVFFYFVENLTYK